VRSFEQVLITAAVFDDVPEELTGNTVRISRGTIVEKERVRPRLMKDAQMLQRSSEPVSSPSALPPCLGDGSEPFRADALRRRNRAPRFPSEGGSGPGGPWCGQDSLTLEIGVEFTAGSIRAARIPAGDRRRPTQPNIWLRSASRKVCSW
jgi:hypothetical protein